MIENKDIFQKKTNKQSGKEIIHPPKSLHVRGSGEMEIYRFAPSPTGYLHVGGARTAIYNWLLARQNKGKFFVRIEDTDQKRSDDDSVQNIIRSLEWLGLFWDEDLVFQSSRQQRHLDVVSDLLQSGKAYYCFCERKDEDQDDACRQLSSIEINRNLAENVIHTVRIHIPAEEIEFTDRICGEIKVDHTGLNDFIIVRSDKTPVYHLAVVVDDHDMGITHVIRGADHLSNTAKQIVIYKALGWSIPEFSHLPLILSEDKSRLSKRHGAVAVNDFRNQGILPEALFNYLCLLGWSPGNDQEILNKNEIINIFSLDRVNSHNAIFDKQKLLWMNGKYISSIAEEEILHLISPFITEDQVKIFKDDKAALLQLWRMLKKRSRTLADIVEGMKFYFSDPDGYDPEGIKKYFSSSDVVESLKMLQSELKNGAGFDEKNLEVIVRNFAEKQDVSAAIIIHPLRLALTGKTFSPGIFEVMQVLGKEKVLRRIDKAVEYIKKLK